MISYLFSSSYHIHWNIHSKTLLHSDFHPRRNTFLNKKDNHKKYSKPMWFNLLLLQTLSTELAIFEFTFTSDSIMESFLAFRKKQHNKNTWYFFMEEHLKRTLICNLLTIPIELILTELSLIDISILEYLLTYQTYKDNPISDIHNTIGFFPFFVEYYLALYTWNSQTYLHSMCVHPRNISLINERKWEKDKSSINLICFYPIHGICYLWTRLHIYRPL